MQSAALCANCTSPDVFVIVPSFSYAHSAGSTMSAHRAVSVKNMSCTISKSSFPNRSLFVDVGAEPEAWRVLSGFAPTT